MILFTVSRNELIFIIQVLVFSFLFTFIAIIWAAKANFEENEKGSLEKGKFADFVILDTDFLKSSPRNILKTKVLKTYINGEKVYEAK